MKAKALWIILCLCSCRHLRIGETLENPRQVAIQTLGEGKKNATLILTATKNSSKKILTGNLTLDRGRAIYEFCPQTGHCLKSMTAIYETKIQDFVASSEKSEDVVCYSLDRLTLAVSSPMQKPLQDQLDSFNLDLAQAERVLCVIVQGQVFASWVMPIKGL